MINKKPFHHGTAAKVSKVLYINIITKQSPSKNQVINQFCVLKEDY